MSDKRKGHKFDQVVEILLVFVFMLIFLCKFTKITCEFSVFSSGILQRSSDIRLLTRNSRGGGEIGCFVAC